MRNAWRMNMPHAREHYIYYIGYWRMTFWGECIEKRFLFFEHKGTRIF